MVEEFKQKFEKLNNLHSNELKLIIQQNHKNIFEDICEAKRNIAKSMTDYIQPIGNVCVDKIKERKKFVLNTLLLLETTLEYICNMNQSIFHNIYELHSENCFIENLQNLRNCQKKSFVNVIFFWIPQKTPTLMQLLNGATCNFNYDKMLECSKTVLSTSQTCSHPDEAFKLLIYQIDTIKANSQCFKHKTVSEIIDESSEDSSNIVT
ncbi:CLUMA_CG018057, isoform A [Clunio marinus]|uniref:CLUMA_CG018057, isoform A n=1 Tax=Clunio marinus TaxID=568069 RepID=A0A1J1J0W8_9DIPT|nr:CLUMA_CG018057, isoform A [Clunio marinus]